MKVAIVKEKKLSPEEQKKKDAAAKKLAEEQDKELAKYQAMLQKFDDADKAKQ